jgi:alpha-tubulin suppressor-like RCC1 family protein
MARFLSLRLAAIAVGSFGSLVSLAACTALLGDYEVTATTGTPDTGAPDNTTTTDGSDDAPVDVQPDVKPNGFNGVRAIAAGARHTCAIVNAGEVYCWGDNAQGQLAQPLSIARLAKPRKVNIAGVAAKIATFANHTCVIMANGDINCWGANASGQCGTGDKTSPAQPHVVNTPGKQWEEVSPGVEHTCAVDQGGQVYCWGANNGGQSGSSVSLLPTAAGGEKTPLTSIASANLHTCAAMLPSGGNGVRCWGTEDKGALGDGAPANTSNPTAVTALGLNAEIKEVAVGGGHTCARDATGDVKCWGDNALGQLGISPAGSFIDAPAAKIGMQPLAAVSAGGATSCGIAVQNRTLACIGSNASGQLGRGGTKDTSPHPEVLPVLRPDGTGQPLEGVVSVAVGRDHVCASVGTGLDLFCWGEGADGQVGDAFGGMARTLPVRVGLPE